MTIARVFRWLVLAMILLGPVLAVYLIIVVNRVRRRLEATDVLLELWSATLSGKCDEL